MKNFKTGLLLFIIFVFSQLLYSQQLYQVSYYEALNKAKLDGFISLQEVIKHGNTGIGGYHALNGEMILLEGKFYQVLADGKILTPDLSDKVCFAAVYNFIPQKNLSIKGDSNLQRAIDRLVPNQNIILAIKISGVFEYVKTRSVPGQNKPYPVLTEIVKTQSIFEGRKIKGTIVGIRTPSFTAGLNPTGYHLHFISDDKTIGGHLLESRPLDVKCEVMVIDEITVKLPSE
jgi:acetolactate decarboxylase